MVLIDDETRLDPLGAGEDVSHRIAAWAARRYGLISRVKLLDLGLTRHEIDRRVRTGWLIPAGRGLYFVGHRSGVEGQREALALALAGPGAALAGPSAAAWQRMTEPWLGPVHLIVPASRSGRRPGVVRHLDALDPAEVVVVSGLACVRPERAVMDLPQDRLRQALQWLMTRGIALEPIVERMHGRRGAAAFRAEVEALVPQMTHALSELEHRFLRLCRRHGLPLPMVNEVRAGRDLLDCVWPGSPVVVELDGRRWHQHRDEQDRARDRRRMREGRLPFRYGWSDVTRHAARTAEELRPLVRDTI